MKQQELAKQAIRMVFNDTTVSHEQTLERLEELSDMLDTFIDVVGLEFEREIIQKRKGKVNESNVQCRG